jgi:thiamine pyrophosphokinase
VLEGFLARGEENGYSAEVSANPKDVGSGPRRGLLVIGGDAPSPQTLARCAREADIVIAADSGYDACRAAGVVPDLVVGDMDSLSDRRLLAELPASRVREFPRDKDETDTEIGVRLLREKGCGPVTIAGGGGGRLDHLLGVVALFERDQPPSRWLTTAEEIVLVEGAAEIGECAGATISVFPLGDGAGDMRSEGLYWPLDGLSFGRGTAGISNRATSDIVRIFVGRGRLLVIKSIVRDS